MRLLTWPSRGFDGARMSAGSDGRLYEVFDPPWRALHRWVAWLAMRWTRPRIARGRITLTSTDFGSFEVRTFEVQRPPTPRIRGRRLPN